MQPSHRIERERLAAEANRKHREARRGRQNARILLPVLDGCVFVFSDHHYWPDEITPAHKAFLKLIPVLKPWAIINNGDSFDGASISRFPRIGWEHRPTIREELKVNDERLAEVKAASKGYAKWHIWNLGNHDMRAETFLAARVPEFQNVDGFTLKSHFPDWLPAWSTWIGDDMYGAVIKHRMRNGKYAAANDTLLAGRTTVTSHDHTLWIKAFSDYNGTRWGVKTGTIADVYGPQFKDYSEDNPADQQSGFAILHFRNGRCTGPELVHALQDGTVLFRGDILKV